MAAKGYTTEALVEAEILQDITVNTKPTTAQVAQWIEEAEAEIDEMTSSSFTSTTTTDSIIPFTDETAFVVPTTNYFSGNVRADSGGTRWENGFFLQDTCGIQRRPIISITNMCTNSSTACGTAADSFTALTEQTGSGGDFIVDCRTGRVTLLACKPIWGHPRGIKTTFVYGYSATVPTLIKDLATKMVARRIIKAKVDSSNFLQQDNISLETLTVTKNTPSMVVYLKSVDEEIRRLKKEVIGSFKVDVVRN
jgi:hypothetical protein